MWLFQPVAQTLAIEYTKLSSPLSPLSCHPYHPVAHMAVSACCNDGTEENASNTCGLAVSACCLQLSNTWLCQPVAQTWLCQPAVSMLHVAEQTHVGWLFQPAAQCILEGGIRKEEGGKRMRQRGEGNGRSRKKGWCWDEEGRRRKKGESFGTRRNHSKRCMLRLAVSAGGLQI